jgi:hypothetical protein
LIVLSIALFKIPCEGIVSNSEVKKGRFQGSVVWQGARLPDEKVDSPLQAPGSKKLFLTGIKGMNGMRPQASDKKRTNSVTG